MRHLRSSFGMSNRSERIDRLPCGAVVHFDVRGHVRLSVRRQELHASKTDMSVLTQAADVKLELKSSPSTPIEIPMQ